MVFVEGMAELLKSIDIAFSPLKSDLTTLFLIFRSKLASQTIEKVIFPYEKHDFSSSIRSAVRE